MHWPKQTSNGPTLLVPVRGIVGFRPIQIRIEKVSDLILGKKSAGLRFIGKDEWVGGNWLIDLQVFDSLGKLVQATVEETSIVQVMVKEDGGDENWLRGRQKTVYQ
ncbi:hypothetical protein QVD17_29621 [Tagetes erecta]|uniref:Uncharacterized protein n=1 Tax=Tagetes erecta TaxID=13708 RepID=A0AAD8JZY0_TARER|nr:hypothetical protein QVD17_29621 [Tagetes erecta]